MNTDELSRVKYALLKELDVTFQRYYHQRLREVMSELSRRYVDIKPDPTPDDVFDVLCNYRILNYVTAAPVREMRVSLERLKNGTYGRCAQCGREISADLLERHPTASVCSLCQSRPVNGPLTIDIGLHSIFY